MWNWIVEYSNAAIAVSLSLGLISLLLIFWQIYSARKWNKLHFTYTFFPDPFQLEEVESFLDHVIRFWKIDEPLSEIEVKAIMTPDDLTGDEVKKIGENIDEEVNGENVLRLLNEAGRKLKLYMNQIETYCAAIRAGVIDSESAKMVYGYKFMRTYQRAKPWIDKFRLKKNEPSLYIEIENVLKMWSSVESQKKKY